MPVEVSCVDCVKVSWQILFYVQFARWRIVDDVYDVLLPVVWPDMNVDDVYDVLLPVVWPDMNVDDVYDVLLPVVWPDMNVDDVYDVLLPVVWPDMNALRVFLHRSHELC